MAQSSTSSIPGQPPSKRPRIVYNPMNSLSTANHLLPSSSNHPPNTTQPNKPGKRPPSHQVQLQDGLYVRTSMNHVHPLKTNLTEFEEIPLYLRYFFNLRKRDDPNDEKSEKPLNSKCEENVLKIGNGCQPGTENATATSYKEVLAKGGFEFGYLPNNRIKGYNVQPIGYNAVEDIIQHSPCPLVKLNYGYIRLILNRVKTQLLSHETALVKVAGDINKFAFEQAQRNLKVYEKHNQGYKNSTSKLKYGGLATTIKIGLIENIIPSYPHIEESHSDNVPSFIIQLTGPRSTIRFPQLHADVEISKGNILVAYLGNLLHHYILSDGEEDRKEKRLVMLCYTRKAIEEEYEQRRREMAGDERDGRNEI